MTRISGILKLPVQVTTADHFTCLSAYVGDAVAITLHAVFP